MFSLRKSAKVVVMQGEEKSIDVREAARVDNTSSDARRKSIFARSPFLHHFKKKEKDIAWAQGSPLSKRCNSTRALCANYARMFLEARNI